MRLSVNSRESMVSNILSDLAIRPVLLFQRFVMLGNSLNCFSSVVWVINFELDINISSV